MLLPMLSLNKKSEFSFAFPSELAVFISSSILLFKGGKGFYTMHVLMTWEGGELGKGLHPGGATLYSRT